MESNDLTYSKSGMILTEQFEGCRLAAYTDTRGIWTIGYGHTGPEVLNGLTITQPQAEALLTKDVGSASSCVNQSVTVELNQDEFDALVDFVFNLGPTAFRTSTLLRELNAGEMEAAASQFESWDHCSGMVVAQLLRRRTAEAALFAGPAAPSSNGAGARGGATPALGQS